MSLSRKKSASPLSVGWKLYSPKRLAEALGLPVDKVDKALEETGFNKAVRVREYTIKRKIVLQKAVKEIEALINVKRRETYKLRQQAKALRNEVTGLRNILRIPRENITLSDAEVIEELTKSAA